MYVGLAFGATYLPAHPTWFALAGTKHVHELFFPAKLRAY